MGRWQKTLASGSDIQLQIYYDRTNRLEPNVEDIRNTFDVDFLQRFHVRGRQEISWGLGARAAHADNPTVVSGLTFVPAIRTDQLYSAFLQDEITLVDKRLTFVAGTKVIRTNFTGFEAEPSGRLLWTPSVKQTFWTAFTHAVRTPSDVEENFYLLGFVGIAANGTPELARFNANPNFAPEQLNGYELGYRRLLGTKVSVDIAGFSNHYHDHARRGDHAGDFSWRTRLRRFIFCFRRSSVTVFSAIPKEWKWFPNGGPPGFSGGCGDPIPTCI